jgi:hypothetical protein
MNSDWMTSGDFVQLHDFGVAPAKYRVVQEPEEGSEKEAAAGEE